MILFCYDNIDIAIKSNTQDIMNLRTYAACVKYVRDGASIENLDNNIHSFNVEKASLVFHEGTKVILSGTVVGDGAYIEAPLFNYKGYKAYDENGVVYPIVDGDNCLVRVLLPDGFVGNIIAEFHDFY